jgi:chromosome segregation ATPase
MNWRLYVIPETLKLLEQNIEETFKDTGIGKDFLSRSPITQEIVAKIINVIASN